MRLQPLPPAAATVAAIVWGLFLKLVAMNFSLDQSHGIGLSGSKWKNSKKMMEKPAWGRQERRDLPIWEKQIADDQFSHTDCL